MTRDELIQKIDREFTNSTASQASVSEKNLKNLLFNLCDFSYDQGQQAAQIGSVTGWADYADDYFTEGTPFQITAATTFELPNNAQNGVISQAPSDAPILYIPKTLAFDAQTGSFTEGQVVTGGTSSATGTITHVEVNGTSGLLYLANVSGTFQDEETITDPVTGSATVNGTITNGVITGRNGDGILITVDCKVKPTNANTNYVEFWFDIGGSVGELYRRIISFPKGNGVERAINFTVSGYTLDTWQANGAKVFVEADNTADIYDIRFVITRTHKAK